MPTDTKKYNGWANYETWCVHLWLSNEEGTYHEARRIVRGGLDYQAAGRLKEWVEEMRPEMEASMFSDLLGAALSEVDWLEVSEAFRDKEAEESDDTEEGEE